MDILWAHTGAVGCIVLISGNAMILASKCSIILYEPCFCLAAIFWAVTSDSGRLSF